MSTNLVKQEEKKELKPADRIRRDLNSPAWLEQIKRALPPHIPPERFVRIAITAVVTNNQLLDCEPNALYAELMKSAQDGLLPDGREAAIVMYGPQPRYMPMVAGICKKARNSGEIKTLNAHVVHENDEYDSWTDETGDHFKFKNARKDRGLPKLTFAFAVTKDGGFYFEEIDETEMAFIEKCSRAKSGPWKSDFRKEMMRKSAIRRLAKYRLPSSTDLDEVIRRDDDLYTLDPPKITAESSATALAAHQASKDFLPGIKPQATAEQFVARLKSVPNGPPLIQAQIQVYSDRGDTASVEKLIHASKAAGLFPVVPEVGSEEDIISAANETAATKT